jgi:hypothetical protein
VKRGAELEVWVIALKVDVFLPPLLSSLVFLIYEILGTLSL